MQLKGIHHVTAITSSAEKIYDFFTNVLGLRLVKKTVNQDDIDTYHLFFADDLGSPGTDMTFFDFKGISKAVHGNNELNRTGFRVPNDKSLEYWLKRFNHYKVKHSEIKTMFGKKIIEFEDFDGQLYALISDELNSGVNSGTPWKNGPVPDHFAITGLGPIYINVSRLDGINTILTEIFLMRQTKVENNYYLYEMGEGGNGASLIINYQQNNKPSYQGYGAIHHIAFRVGNKEDLSNWQERLDKFGAPNSGYVDRFYFKSVYTRLYLNVLFELATDEPGFIDDEETYINLGETLALPPKFRNNRAYIEKVVRHIDTVRSNKVFEKEYFNE
ncbi:VOC family protein [Haploplasma modicum]|uniref:VOC family protein n=1 Tax=Haploplasma modicum TaxID=2150 RepID=UPI00054EBCBB|nr:VOC family protein [Haploplasma modicum]